MTQVLAVKGLTVDFPVAEGERSGTRQVVAGIDFDIYAGRTLGVVGESGCGKTLSALAVMGLVPRPGRVGGSVMLEGQEMLVQGRNPCGGACAAPV
jgi:ABC-type glutathione transport system ATPase component